MTHPRWPRLCWYKRYGVKFPLIFRTAEGGLWLGRFYVYWPRVLKPRPLRP